MPPHAAHSATLYSNLAHILTHMVMILYATAVLYLPAEFNLSYGEMLGFASLGGVLYGVAALPAGWLGDRWSQVGMMVVFFAGVGVSTIGVGMAGTPLHLYLGLSLIGLFAAIYHPVGIAWLIASSKKQGLTMGINGLCGGIGAALAAPFVGVMIDALSWRYAFIIPGAISLLAGALLLIGWRRGTVPDVTAEQAPAPTQSAHAKRQVFLVLTLTMACTGFIYAGITHTLPKLFEQGLNTQLAASYTEIGFYVGAVVFVASLTSLLGGWLADRFSPRSTYILFWLLAILPLFFISKAADEPLLLLALIALACISGFAAAENMLVARYTPFEWRSLAYGAKFVLSLGIGGLTIQLAGSLFDTTGDFSLLYWLLGVAAVIAAIGAILLPAGQTTVAAPASVQ